MNPRELSRIIITFLLLRCTVAKTRFYQRIMRTVNPFCSYLTAPGHSRAVVYCFINVNQSIVNLHAFTEAQRQNNEDSVFGINRRKKPVDG